MSSPALVVRSATTSDAAACSAIYTPYVIGTSITFEVEPPTADDFKERITHAQTSHAWLVVEQCDRTVVGYAYAHRFSERAAYDWSCETSIYLADLVRGQGIGRTLYQDLLGMLARRGYRRAFAGIALPNEASIGLHRALGFEEAGCYRRVGWKSGVWHDVTWMQTDLQTCELDPPAPISASTR